MNEADSQRERQRERERERERADCTTAKKTVLFRMLVYDIAQWH